jgi:hypothetical protein
MVSPYEKLFSKKSKRSELRTWGCLCQVRIPPESRQRKEKLAQRARMCLLLGFSMNTKGYKLLDLVTRQVTTDRREHVHFYEGYTAEGGYVRKLLENTFMAMAHELPSAVPIAQIKTDIESYLPMELRPTRDEPNVIRLQSETSLAMSGPTASIQNHSSTSRNDIPLPIQPNNRGKRRKTSKRDDDADYVDPGVSAPSSPSSLKRPRRARKPSVRLRDYVVSAVCHDAQDVVVPTTFKQAKASKEWPQWQAAMRDELRSLREHET